MRPRIRTIKPEIGADEELWDLGLETGLPVYQTFTLLWCCADREGRFEWRPRALKAVCLPYWDGDFARVLDALATRGFLVRYTRDGRVYGLVRTFAKHQHINGREPMSDLPAPEKTEPSQHVDASTTCDSHDDDASSSRGSRDDPFPSLPFPIPEGGVGGAGTSQDTAPVYEPTDQKPKRPRKRSVGPRPASWAPNQHHMEFCEETKLDLHRECQRFIDHHDAKGSVFADWDAAFRTWLRNSVEFAKQRQGGQAPAGPTDAERELAKRACQADRERRRQLLAEVEVKP